MLLDNQSIFSDAQAITATAASTNSIDLGAVGITGYGKHQLVRDLGKSGHIPLLIQVVEAFDNLTSLKIDIQVDDNSSFSSAKTVQSETVLLADLVAGRISPMDKLPRGIDERYLRLYFTVTGTAPTAGKITAGIVAAVDGVGYP